MPLVAACPRGANSTLGTLNCLSTCLAQPRESSGGAFRTWFSTRLSRLSGLNCRWIVRSWRSCGRVTTPMVGAAFCSAAPHFYSALVLGRTAASSVLWHFPCTRYPVSHRPESRVRFSPAGLALSGRGIQLCLIDALWRPQPSSCCQLRVDKPCCLPTGVATRHRPGSGCICQQLHSKPLWRK